MAGGRIPLRVSSAGEPLVSGDPSELRERLSFAPNEEPAQIVDWSPNCPIRVLVVDDHPIVREGVVALLGADPVLEVVGEADSGEDALAEVERLRPGVVVLDIMLPGMSGIEAGRVLLAQRPEVRVVMLTSFSNLGVLRAALSLGVHGIVKKDSHRTVLREAVRAVGSGDRYVDPEVATRLSQWTSDAKSRGGRPRGITLMEREVLELLPRGLTNKEIAGLLGVSDETVKAHLAHAMCKLEARTRSEAAAVALEGRLR